MLSLFKSGILKILIIFSFYLNPIFACNISDFSDQHVGNSGRPGVFNDQFYDFDHLSGSTRMVQYLKNTKARI